MRSAIAACILLPLPVGVATGTAEPLQHARGEPLEFADYPEYVDRWAVIVGISRYADERLNLQFADRDADRLHELIRTPSGGLRGRPRPQAYQREGDYPRDHQGAAIVSQ